ncbi:hypothetical protein [Micromonospora sp. B11E3]|uniref:hypothetical protein n=1 Tax=Micromonospora sp. B11E3 TaxID=3153562 RepID=UPI00325FA32D
MTALSRGTAPEMVDAYLASRNPIRIEETVRHTTRAAPPRRAPDWLPQRDA